MSDDRERREGEEETGWAPFGRPEGADAPPPLAAGDPLGAPEPSPADPPPPPAEPPPPPPAEPGPVWSGPQPPEPPEPPPAQFEPPQPPPIAPQPGPAWPPPQAPGPPPATGGAGNWPPPGPPPATGGGGNWPARSGGQAAAGQVPGTATAALVLGIIGIFVCPIVCSVAAIVLGLQARNEIDRTPGLGGRGMAQAGIILGVVGIVFFFVGLAIGLGGLFVNV